MRVVTVHCLAADKHLAKKNFFFSILNIYMCKHKNSQSLVIYLLDMPGNKETIIIKIKIKKKKKMKL